MRDALDCGESLRYLHLQHAVHETQRLCAHFTDVSFFESFRLVELGEFEADEAGVLIKLVLE